jgi:hypothetical protein
VRAMDHATRCFAKGDAGIPDAHGEFFLAALPLGLELYEGRVPAAQLALWRQRIAATKTADVVRGGLNNWRAYAMKGQWRRAQLGLVDRRAAVAFIEDAWLHAEQRNRIADNRWNLYEDLGTFPESHAVEGVGRGNLLALIAESYDGPSNGDMRKAVERGTTLTLLLQDPSGQCPPDGRTDDHVWNDVLYQLCFDVMAERAKQQGNERLAGQFRHAAMLSFSSIERWRRSDGPWAGSFFVTKNHFDPALRVGYQPASNYGNYNGAVMLHLAEAWLARQSDIAEQPAPAEIGGYAFATDAKFATAIANAGGMQMFAALRGDTNKVFDRYWTALGVERFARVGWDTRLGPSDGERDAKTGKGVTFAPTWVEDGKWVRMADVPERYQGKFSVQLAHPLLVRCTIDYSPRKAGGPTFRQQFVLTPDGILAITRSADAKQFGVTLPILENDGAALEVSLSERIVRTAFRAGADQQNFIALDAGATLADEPPVRSSYGDLRPVRAGSGRAAKAIFIYPRSPGDPAAEKVRDSFRLPDRNGGATFSSLLGRVREDLYVGRTAAGGVGQQIDLHGDGKPDVVFSQPCGFVLQLRDGKVIAAEADRAVAITIGGETYRLAAFTPRMF